jgi:hypothetical protein
MEFKSLPIGVEDFNDLKVISQGESSSWKS